MRFDVTALADCFGLSVSDNMRSTIAGLEARGAVAGLDWPHRLVQFLAQIAHESAEWRFDRELWGPTRAQKGYEGRTDLGNTQQGDGLRFRGRGPIQVTGRANYHEFTAWAKEHFRDAPDFVEDPDLLNTDPWEGISPIWYWGARDLNRYADVGNNEMVTRRINGGLNGFDDRLRLYDQAALWFTGAASLRAFQAEAGINVDGVSGPQTRGAMHNALLGMAPVKFGAEPSVPVQPIQPATQDLATLIGQIISDATTAQDLLKNGEKS